MFVLQFKNALRHLETSGLHRLVRNHPIIQYYIVLVIFITSIYEMNGLDYNHDDNNKSHH